MDVVVLPNFPWIVARQNLEDFWSSRVAVVAVCVLKVDLKRSRLTSIYHCLRTGDELSAGYAVIGTT